VGLRIISQAAQHPARDGIKKVIAEMGGKNAIIVDADADLDVAVTEVVASAFGYAGQKCSAASRVVVLEAAHDEFVARLVEATRSLHTGPPEDPATRVPPVISAEARERIESFIATGEQEATVALGPADDERPDSGYYVSPRVFTGVRPDAVIAQEEIFGPVLSVIRARDFDKALAWANAGTYKLTGGVFSRRPSHLEQARREFHVGVLYLNRGVTGALVGRQPFGGFGLSGTGTQAGGPEYLLNFVLPRSVCENTLRHGFAPGLE